MRTTRSCSVLTALAVAVALVASGCSFTTVETARQLDHGDQVYSGSADFPGFFLLPRLNAAAKFGLGGGGDIGVHAGTNLVSYNVGAGGRVYPTDFLIVSLQGNTMVMPSGSEVMGQSVDGPLLSTVTPRVMNAIVDDAPPIYGGLQSNIFMNIWGGFEYHSAAIGPFFGVDFMPDDAGFGFQTELILMPLAISPEGQFATPGAEDGFLLFQFSVGGYFRNTM